MREAIHELFITERGRWVVARITGDIDHSNATEVEDALRERAGVRPLLVDLSAVQYLDSAGVAMLDSQRRRSELALVLPARSVVRRVLEITAFDQLVSTFESLEQALQS